MSDPTIDITAKQFARLVRPLVPLANKDGMLPTLHAIKFETQADHLVGSATDRFRMGIHRVRLDDPPADTSFILSLGSVARIVALFKPTRFGDPALRFTIEDDRVRVDHSGGLDFMDASVAFPIVDGDFPNLRGIINKAIQTASEPAKDVAFNAAFLADFRHAITDATPLVIRASVGRTPSLFLAGDDFIGALMPVNSEVAADVEFKMWDAFLSPSKKRTRQKKEAAA